MTAFSFDTHQVVKDLEQAGFNETQAEAVVAALGASISGNLATKADLDLLKAELKADLKSEAANLRTEFKADIAELRTEFKADIAELKNDNASTRSELKAESNSLRSEMQSLELRMTVRLGAMVTIATAVIVAAVKFL